MERQIRDGLTAAQGVALQIEAHSIQNLLRDGYRSIRGIRRIAASADSVFVVASVGVEKAMRLMLGLGDVRERGQWPPAARIQGWGESLAELDASLEETLTRSAPAAAHPEYSALLLAGHRSDRLWHLFLHVLDRYGSSPQFAVIDRLGEVNGSWEAPLETWSRLEFAILSQRSTLAEVLSSPFESEAGREEVSAQAARTLLRLWNLIHQFCVEGCFGERGAILSVQLAPPGPEELRTDALVASPFTN
jgi:hypothetical protein